MREELILAITGVTASTQACAEHGDGVFRVSQFLAMALMLGLLATLLLFVSRTL